MSAELIKKTINVVNIAYIFIRVKIMRKPYRTISDEQYKVIVGLDIEGFKNILRKQGDPIPKTDHIALMALHKARVRVPSIPEKLKEISKEWLIAQGCQRF